MPVLDHLNFFTGEYFKRLCVKQEIPENGADLAHLGLVHEAVLLAGTDITTMRNKIYEFGKHFWKAEWKQDEEKHMGSLWLKHSLKLFGFHVSAVDMKVRAQQVATKTTVCKLIVIQNTIITEIFFKKFDWSLL